VILAVSAALLLLYYATLELAKRIVNCALGNQPSHFPHPIGVPGFILFEVDRVSLLIIFCVTLLAIYLAHGRLKYFVNVYKAVLGERMLLVLRRELYEAVSERG
jgi:putative ABC transport system ATP-binding protein